MAKVKIELIDNDEGLLVVFTCDEVDSNGMPEGGMTTSAQALGCAVVATVKANITGEVIDYVGTRLLQMNKIFGDLGRN